MELRFVDGMDTPRLARALRKPEPEVERLVAQARAFLRQRLLESGCVLEPARR